MKRMLLKTISLVLLLAFFATTCCYGLATLPASQNPVTKREIEAALQRTQIRYAGSEDAIRLLNANNASCLLLSSGKYLVTREIAENDLKLLRAIIHEDIEAVMQILMEEGRRNNNNKYQGVKELVLKYFPPNKGNNFPIELYVNHTIARALEWLILLEDKIIVKGEIPPQERAFIDAIKPIIMASRHNYFTAEFWDSKARSEKIRVARNSGMVFYQVAANQNAESQEIERRVSFVGQKTAGDPETHSIDRTFNAYKKWAESKTNITIEEKVQQIALTYSCYLKNYHNPLNAMELCSRIFKNDDYKALHSAIQFIRERYKLHDKDSIKEDRLSELAKQAYTDFKLSTEESRILSFAIDLGLDRYRFPGVNYDRVRSKAEWLSIIRQDGDSGFAEYISQQKACLSVDPIAGCSIDCAYCFRDEKGEKRPTRLKDDLEIIVDLFNHPFFIPDQTPIGLQISKTDPFLPQVKESTFTILEFLDRLSLKNQVCLVTKLPLKEEDVMRLARFKNIRLSVGCTFSNMPRAIEPLSDPEKTKKTIALLKKYDIRSMLFLRPIIIGQNDSENSIRTVLSMAKGSGVDAIIVGGIRLSDKERAYMRKCGIVIPAYETEDYKKYLPNALQEKILRIYKELGLTIPMVRRQSCARSLIWGIPDFNAHWVESGSNCWETCPISQKAICAGKERPKDTDVKDLLKRIGRDNYAFTITDRAVIFEEPLSVFEKSFLRNNLSFQVEDKKTGQDAARGVAVKSTQGKYKVVFEKRYELEDRFLKALRDEFAKKLSAIMRKYNNETMPSGIRCSKEISGLYDEYIIKIFRYCRKAFMEEEHHYIQVSLVALGGSFFRGEMSPGSDIDFGLIFGDRESDIFRSIFRKKFSAILEKFGVTKADAHFPSRIKGELIKGTINNIDRSITEEIRLLSGASEPVEDFKNWAVQYYERSLSLDPVKIMESFTFDIVYQRMRWDKYGSSGSGRFNLKKGKGGLRDIAHIIWLARLLELRNRLIFTDSETEINSTRTLNAAEKKTLIDALNFLLAIRNMLHDLSADHTDDQLDLASAEKVAQATRWAISGAQIIAMCEHYSGQINEITNKLTNEYIEKMRFYKGRRWRASFTKLLNKELSEDELATLCDTKNTDIAMLVAYHSKNPETLKEIYNNHERAWSVAAILAANDATPPDILMKLGMMEGYINRDVRVCVARNKSPPIAILMNLSKDSFIHVRSAAKASILRLEPRFSKLVDICGDFAAAVDLLMARVNARGEFTDVAFREELEEEIDTANIIYWLVERLGLELYNGEGYEGAKRKVIDRLYTRPDRGLEDLSTPGYIPGGFKLDTFIGDKGVVAEDYNAVLNNIMRIAEHGCSGKLASGDSSSNKQYLRSFRLLLKICFAIEGRYVDRRAQEECNLMLYNFARLYFASAITDMSMDPMSGYKKNIMGACMRLLEEKSQALSAVPIEERIRTLLRLKISSNRIDFVSKDLKNKSAVELIKLITDDENNPLAIDDRDEFIERIVNNKRFIVWDMDNASEAPLTLYLIQEVLSHWAAMQGGGNYRITIVPKAMPVVDDSTYADINGLLESGIFERLRKFIDEGKCEILKRGPCSGGTNYKELSIEHAQAYREACEKDGIVIKDGIANLSTSAGGVPKVDTFYLFTAKGPWARKVVGRFEENVFGSDAGIAHFVPKELLAGGIELFYGKYPSDKDERENFSAYIRQQHKDFHIARIKYMRYIRPDFPDGEAAVLVVKDWMQKAGDLTFAEAVYDLCELKRRGIDIAKDGNIRQGKVDFHVHSYHSSDGSISLETLVKIASFLGLEAIAVSDHGTVDGIQEAIEYGRRFNVGIVPAIELSTIADGRKVHILGYKVDWENTEFKKSLENIQEKWNGRLKKVLNTIREKTGAAISLDEVMRETHRKYCDMDSIATVLVKRGLARDAQEAKNKYLSPDSPNKTNAYEPLSDKYLVSPEDAISLIKKYGGIPVIAHPAKDISNSQDLAEISSLITGKLITAGLEGIEVFHPAHSEVVRQDLMHLAEKNGLLVFGGSDYDGNQLKGIKLGVGTETAPVDIPYSYYVKNILQTSMMAPLNSEDDIAHMTLEQKVAYMIRPGSEWSLPYGEDKRLFDKFGIPFGRLNERYLTGPRQVAEKVNELLMVSGQPVLLNLNQEGGRLNFFNFGNTQMPGNMAIAATRSEKYAYDSAAIIAREMRSMGITWNIIPMCEAVIDGRNSSISTRSFGQDINLVCALTKATVKGSQDNGVACMAKLFPGNRLSDVDPHESLDFIDILEEDDLAPFKAAIEAGVASIMINHHVYSSIDDNPATLSKKVMSGLLREKLHFKGLIITDTLTMGALTMGALMWLSPAEAAVMAIEAGADIAFIDPDLSRIKEDAQAEESSNNRCMKDKARAYHAVIQAIRDGRISEKRIDESLRRILEVKKKYGINTKLDPAAAVAMCNLREHKEAERRISADSITLLRNRTGMLPLALDEKKKILVVTAKPDKIARANSSYEVTFRLADHVKKIHQNTENVIVSNPEEISKEKIASADVVIAVTYNAYFPNRQGRFAQKDIVDKLLVSGKPVIACAIGSPYDIIRFPDVDTYVVSYNVRDASMRALADVLFGVSKPKGKLPVTIPGLFDLGSGETDFAVSSRGKIADLDRTYVLIMAGGGTGLWPLSTQERPENFCSFFSDGKSMIRTALKRALAIVPKERVLIGVPEYLYDAFRKELPELSQANFIVEPMAKDTANIIGLAAAVLSHKRKDATMIVLSGDQEVRGVNKFVGSMTDAVRAAQSGPVLVPIGIKPTSPHTGYGYIKTGEEIGIGKNILRGIRFIEKPDLATANEYVKTGNYYWNGGMFAWDVNTILSEFARFQPVMYEGFMRIRDAVGTPDEDRVKREVFEKLPRMSIDRAVMEKTDNTVVVGEFPWSDLGDWNFVAEFGQKDANDNTILGTGRSNIKNSKGCIVFAAGGQEVEVKGLENHAVIVTSSVVLVTPNKSTQRIRELQQDMQNNPSLRPYIEKDKRAIRKDPKDLTVTTDGKNVLIGEAFVTDAKNCLMYSDTGLVTVMDVNGISVIREGNIVRVFKTLAREEPISVVPTDPSDRYDTKPAVILLTDLLHAQLHEDRVYEIKYDASRLTTSQIEIIEEYARLLQLRSSNPDSIKLRPFASARGSGESLIAVYCTGKDFKGEGHVDVAIPDGELKEYLLRITGMVNIALASSNIPDNLTKEEVDKYSPVMSYIKNQYKAILGEELTIPDSPEDILKVIRRVVLGLPKSMRMNIGQIEEFNRLAKAALTAA